MRELSADVVAVGEAVEFELFGFGQCRQAGVAAFVTGETLRKSTGQSWGVGAPGGGLGGEIAANQSVDDGNFVGREPVEAGRGAVGTGEGLGETGRRWGVRGGGDEGEGG